MTSALKYYYGDVARFTVLAIKEWEYYGQVRRSVRVLARFVTRAEAERMATRYRQVRPRDLKNLRLPVIVPYEPNQIPSPWSKANNPEQRLKDEEEY